jgi:ferric-dicitrate binding protein FerR (iron transport regulator)
MDQERLVELWSRLLADETLAPTEAQELFDQLAGQPALREQLLADESVDTILRQMARTDATNDRFVERVMQRTGELDQNATVSDPLADLAEAIRPKKTPTDDPPLTLHTEADRLRRRKRRERLWQVATLAACCAVALAIFVVVRLSPTTDRQVVKDRTHNKKSTPQKSTLPDNVPTFDPESPVVAPISLATLIGKGARWKSPPAADGRLTAGELELLEGDAELQFDNGSIVRLSGPAVLDVRRVDEVYLKQGTLTASIPHQAIGFSVLTPTSRVVDLGTEFKVDVAKSGVSNTSVIRGKVSVEPQHDGKTAGKPISLAAGELDRATTWQPETEAPAVPVFVSVNGPKEQFFGTINCNGGTAEFRSREMFKKFESRTLKRLKESPNSFGKDWLILTSTFTSSGGSHIEFNGKRMDIDKIEDAFRPPEEFMRHISEMPQMPNMPKNGSPNSKGEMHGVLMINGKRVEFHSQAELDAARKKLLGEWMDQ